MEILSYIIPNELVLRCIIFCIVVLWCYVFYRAVGVWRIAHENLAMLDKMRDVHSLEESLRRDSANYNQVFAAYADDVGRNKATEVLFEHVKDIYDAGSKNSRLDSELLVKNTISKIFTNIDIVRTGISMFLVIGILGTLVGLAISISSFHGENFMMSGQVQSLAMTSEELTKMFGNLRGAFAPSMWGVFLTIVSVLLYTYFIQERCVNALTEKLTIFTIRYWLPSLYPSDFQRTEMTRVKLNKTIANAEGINDGVTKLEKNLNESNATVKALSDTAKKITDAALRFDKSTTKLTKLEQLYTTLKQSNDAYSQSIQKLVSNASKERQAAYEEYVNLAKRNTSDVKIYQDAMQKKFEMLQQQLLQQANLETQNFEIRIHSLNEAMKQQSSDFAKIIDSQNAHLAGIIQQLQQYNNSFYMSFDDTRKQLLQSIQANKDSVKVNQLISRENQKLEQELQTVISKTMGSQDALLKAVTAPIMEQLRQVSASLNAINEPLRGATEKMQAMMENNAKALNYLIQPLQESMKKLQEDKDSFAERDRELVTTLKQVDTSLQKLDKKMDLFVAAEGTRAGLDLDTIRSYIEARENGNGAESSNDGKEEKQAGYVKFMPAVIGVLLLAGVIIQGVMVVKISTMEKDQQIVNEVLMKGEMDSKSSSDSVPPVSGQQ